MAGMEDLEVQGCERCPALVESRSRIVNGVGPPSADLLFAGEAPGQQEDAQGEPFVGRSGAILDEVLREYGLSRAEVRITNCVRCRPPDNRDPHASELEHCRGYLETEIAAVDPTVVITLGRVPSEHLLGREVAVTAEAGSVVRTEVGADMVDVLICVHPAASLYDPSQRATLERVIEKAAAMTGTGGQARIGDF